MPRRPVRAANCPGFYGDRRAAAREMLAGPVGLCARSDRSYERLRREPTVARFRELLTEAARLGVERYERPNLRALNVVAAGLLAPGVAATTRPGAQVKGLGEYLRSRTGPVPGELT